MTEIMTCCWCDENTLIDETYLLDGEIWCYKCLESIAKISKKHGDTQLELVLRNIKHD